MNHFVYSEVFFEHRKTFNLQKPIIEGNAVTKLDQKKGDEKSKPVSGRQLKEGLSRKNLRTFTSTLSARSKVIRF